MAIDTERYCLKCGRDEDRCVCEIEHAHGPAYGTPRASVMPEHMESIVWPEPDAETIKEKEGI